LPNYIKIFYYRLFREKSQIFIYNLILLGEVLGINNLGYTCFLNALLQALAACPKFYLWLQKQKKDKNFVNALFTVLRSMILI